MTLTYIPHKHKVRQKENWQLSTFLCKGYFNSSQTFDLLNYRQLSLSTDLLYFKPENRNFVRNLTTANSKENFSFNYNLNGSNASP
jgi:hypothetical protein